MSFCKINKTASVLFPVFVSPAAATYATSTQKHTMKKKYR